MRDKSILIIGSIGIVILLLPWVFTSAAFHESFNFISTGQIGDTIGGVTAPFIGLLSAFVVWRAFQAQIAANKLF